MANRTTVDNQIALLKSHGITFTLFSESDARFFLQNQSYYYKVKAYRANYAHHRTEDSPHTYEGLDFGHLVELSKLDFSISRFTLTVALGVEHALKIHVNNMLMEENKDDLSEYIVRQLTQYWPHSEIRPNPYTENLARHSENDYQVWHLWELQPFSWQIEFYTKLFEYLHPEEEVPLKYLLFITRKLRNAVSHGNCLLADVNLKTPSISKRNSTDIEVTRLALRMCDKPRNKSTGRTKSFERALDRLIVNNCAAALICHLELVKSPQVLKYTQANALRLAGRLERNHGLYFGDTKSNSPRNRDINETLLALEELCRGYARKAERKASSLEQENSPTF